MTFKLIIADDRVPEGWDEKHTFEEANDVAQATPLAEAMVARFNATLRPERGELPRRLLKVEVTEPDPEPDYDLYSDVPEGCCPACFHTFKMEVRMEYNERWDQDVCPECGYT